MNQHAAKLRQAADEIAKSAKDFVGLPRDPVATDTEAERQAYHEEKRDIWRG